MDVYVELIFEDKVWIIKELKYYGIIVMVGDGINDVFVLVIVDVGIVMGVVGLVVVMEIVDVVLMINDF